MRAAIMLLLLLTGCRAAPEQKPLHTVYLCSTCQSAIKYPDGIEYVGKVDKEALTEMRQYVCVWDFTCPKCSKQLAKRACK